MAEDFGLEEAKVTGGKIGLVPRRARATKSIFEAEQEIERSFSGKERRNQRVRMWQMRGERENRPQIVSTISSSFFSSSRKQGENCRSFIYGLLSLAADLGTNNNLRQP